MPESMKYPKMVPTNPQSCCLIKYLLLGLDETQPLHLHVPGFHFGFCQIEFFFTITIILTLLFILNFICSFIVSSSFFVLAHKCRLLVSIQAFKASVRTVSPSVDLRADFRVIQN